MTTARKNPSPTLLNQRALLHDLRTPVNQIIGYSEMLIEQAQDERLCGLTSDLYKIRTAGGQLLEIINNTPALPTTKPAGHTNGAQSSLLTPDRPAAPKLEGADDVPAALVLIVDDNAMNCDLLSRRLKRQGYNVATAENGKVALLELKARPFDLVLLDIMMPKMDGYEVLQRVKADVSLRHIPVIVISALSEVQSVVLCIEMGADDYLFKPFDPAILKARVGSCLEKKRSHDRELQLYSQLQQSYKRLQKLEKQRDDLTHMVVHDLRTPLTSVIAGLNTLDVVGDLNADQREMMAISLAGGETLLAMINELLDVNKLESGSMQLDYTQLSAEALISDAVVQVATLADSQNLSLVRHIEIGLPELPGDENKLRRTLVNLLGNSIKSTPSGGVVTVQARHSEGAIVFSVTDTGKGIPEEAFERIFEKFGQVTSRDDHHTMSTGLGLTFCKLTVEAHGGRIRVESTPGEGSTFFFTIPLNG